MNKVSLGNLRISLRNRVVSTLLLPAVLTFFSGCASTAAIQDLRSQVPTTARANKPVIVEVISVVPKDIRNYFFFPIAKNVVIGPQMGNPSAFYHLRYQDEFGALLASELVRKGIASPPAVPASATNGSSANSPISVKVAFVNAVFNANFNQYFLEVALSVSGGSQPFMKMYRARSTETQSFVDILTENANEARVRASGVLLDKVILDVDEYLKGTMPAGAVVPS